MFRYIFIQKEILSNITKGRNILFSWELWKTHHGIFCPESSERAFFPHLPEIESGNIQMRESSLLRTIFPLCFPLKNYFPLLTYFKETVAKVLTVQLMNICLAIQLISTDMQLHYFRLSKFFFSFHLNSMKITYVFLKELKLNLEFLKSLLLLKKINVISPQLLLTL